MSHPVEQPSYAQGAQPRSSTSRLSAWIPADSAPLLFIALVWAAQSYLLLDFVRTIGVNIPWYDEWEMVGVTTGKEPMTLDWLWSQHNEHRIPLPRLLYIAVVKLSGYDLRGALFFSVALLSLASAACCVALRRGRGRASYTDAFFPLALLHWGQADNLIWSFQLAFVASAVLYLLALFTLSSPKQTSLGRAALLGACAVTAPLMGGNGLPLVPALGMCTLISAWELWRLDPGRRARWAVPLLLGLLSYALLAFYFVDYGRPAKHPVSPSIQATIKASWEVLSLSIGSGQTAYWPVGGYVVAALGLAALGELSVCLFSKSGLRLRAFRLLAFSSAMVGLALGLAWARAALYPHGLFQARYATLMLPLVALFYLTWELRPSRIGKFMQMSLFLLAALMVQRNRDDGWGEAQGQKGGRLAFRAHIDARVPISVLAQHHCGMVYYICQGTAFADRLRMLRAVGADGFAQLPD